MADNVALNTHPLFYVEVPLDTEYLTEDGLYVAGYRSGQRGQYWGDPTKGTEDPKFKAAPEAFKLGHKDGHADWLASLQPKETGWVKITPENINDIKPGMKIEGFNKNRKDPLPGRDAGYTVMSRTANGFHLKYANNSFCDDTTEHILDPDSDYDWRYWSE